MAILVNKNITLSKFEIVKYQLIHYCFINKIWLGETELNCLSLLGECGPIQMTDFWQLVVDKEVLKHPIGVNNVLRRLQDKKLVIKQKSGKKVVLLNPDLNIQSDGDIVINLKLIKLETKKTTGAISNNREKVEFA